VAVPGQSTVSHRVPQQVAKTKTFRKVKLATQGARGPPSGKAPARKRAVSVGQKRKLHDARSSCLLMADFSR